MIYLAGFTLLVSQISGGSECGYPKSQFLRQVILTYIDTSGTEKEDTLKQLVHYQIYARESREWVFHRNKCWQIIWQDDTAKAWIIPDTVLVFVLSDEPPCGKRQKESLAPEKFYWLDKKGRYAEWEPDERFAGKRFKLYRDGNFYYMAYQGYCLPANQVGNSFEVQFGGDTVGIFNKVLE